MCAKDSASKCRPSKPFTWALAIMNAAADVNPDTTGIDIKSTKNPIQEKISN